MFYSKSIGANFIHLSKSWFRFFLYIYTYGEGVNAGGTVPSYVSFNLRSIISPLLIVSNCISLSEEKYYPTKRGSEHDFPLGREPVISCSIQTIA